MECFLREPLTELKPTPFMGGIFTIREVERDKYFGGG